MQEKKQKKIKASGTPAKFPIPESDRQERRPIGQGMKREMNDKP
ncbi:hypothetical protein T235_12250 [Tannerella sp. oral taxon BU063 isolate Cell 8/11]|uniref:Uncharacterized protein n=1 Tax=Tannerella sp. oral taxon BU063 isolate Cell 8/11 TaxID=1411915 RepID=W2CXV0_9BACT|nr:hypothetical protein T235_12250 [Tannerella sp. oral taxon BU063 isolate Cell 8/11]